jgi:hypothetical protein
VIFSLKNANFGKNFFAFLVLSSVFDKKHNDKKILKITTFYVFDNICLQFVSEYGEFLSI